MPDPQTSESDTQITEPHPSSPASDTTPAQKHSGFHTVVGSVLAAIFGIQSDKNRQRDFKKGNATDFIIVGVITVIILIIGMVLLVSSVLSD
ncbi:MAG: DUF2970 domain-containing protein [Gammaproteobacteria bacterium]